MIVVLARGMYYPKDQWQHKRLVEFYPELRVGYSKIVTISTDNLIQTSEFRAGLNGEWPFFSDNGRKVQKELDIQEYTDPHHDPMIPHTFVVKPGMEIFKIYNGYWFWGRPTSKTFEKIFGRSRWTSGQIGILRLRVCVKPGT